MKWNLILVLFLALTLSACELTEQMEPEKEKTIEANETSTKAMEETEEKMLEVQEAAPEVVVTKSANYTDYEPSAGEGEEHILFFHADWCPTCVKWEKMINSSADDLNENVLILKASYDDETELKKQYEVTKQSTAVFINADGSVAKTEADPSIESVNAFFAE